MAATSPCGDGIRRRNRGGKAWEECFGEGARDLALNGGVDKILKFGRAAHLGTCLTRALA